MKGAESKIDYQEPYEIGRDYHIAATFEQQADGVTLVKWQRRDAATGELLTSGSLTMKGGIGSFVDPVLYLGHSQYTADKDALAAYDEVRLWSDVLTDAQLAASAAAGPDAAITADSEGVRFTAPAEPEPSAQRAAVSNGGFRLMTYNIRYCYDEVSTIVPERTAARIIAENPDFCCVNEVRDSESHPEATLLAKLTGMHKTFYGEGSQGNCVLSKKEPVSWKWAALSYAGYKRFLVVAEFDNVVVAATHLEQAGTETISAHDARMASIHEIRESLAQYAESGKPIFLCGDWNAGPGSDEIALMKEFMTIISPTNGVRTYHGRNATGGSIIDYIAVDTAHADDIYTASAYVIDDIAASDHNPVFAEIYLRPAASMLGWIDESFLTTGRTGAWSPAVAWDAGSWTAELAGENMFTPGSASGGNVATVDVTVAFDAVPQETATPDGSAQCALWLGTNGNFQVWTRFRQGYGGQAGNGEQGTGHGWVDVEADGVTPRTGTEYSIRFTIDYTSK
ncbi:MAG: endonuclease/exonuclease/phosphatase family protein, partial [Kiritimatiellae bacterium]|nr:endonuclease/exonuclease/phosphatase family protein [Kiritimatiellia bacterium]